MKSIFLSHSRADAGRAQWLNLRLRSYGFSVWLDSVRVRVGREVQAEVSSAIQNTDIVLWLVSEASLESKWVQFEINLARAREHLEQITLVIPCLIDPEARPKISDILYIDLTASLESGLSDLLDHLGGTEHGGFTPYIPPSLSVTETAASVELSHRWFTSEAFMPEFRVFSFSSIFVAFGIYITNKLLSNGLSILELLLLIVLIIFTGTFVYPLYAFVALLFNRRTITIDSACLRVQNGPIPTPARNVIYPLRNIRAVEAVERRLHLTANTLVHYVIVVTFNDGRTAELPQGCLMYNPETIVGAAALTSKYLNNTPVEGMPSDLDSGDAPMPELANLKQKRRNAYRDRRQSIILGDLSSVSANGTSVRNKMSPVLLLIGLWSLGYGLATQAGVLSHSVAASLLFGTSLTLWARSRKTIRFLFIPGLAVVALAVVFAYILEGATHVPYVMMSGILCLYVLASLGRLPRSSFKPIHVDPLPSIGDVEEWRSSQGVLDIAISRPPLQGGRKPLVLTNIGEIITTICRWRAEVEGEEIFLTWGRTSESACEAARELIRFRTGLHFLTPPERDELWG
jgi:hypothetical protein